MSDCQGAMILDYSAYSDVVLDAINYDEQIDIFVFDPNGICIKVYNFVYGEFQKSNFQFSLPIEYRGYNAVVWQGIRSENYDSSTMALGKRYENFYLNLLYDTATGSYAGVPDPLWASPIEPIDYCAKITRHRVYMTRLHTEVKLNLKMQLSAGSIVDLDANDYEAKITVANDSYNTDYTLNPECKSIDYTNIGADIGTLRLTTDMDCTLSVGEVSLDLIKYMLATKTDSSLSDQEFLDRTKIWEIDLIVKVSDKGYVAVMLSINGWVQWFSDGGLS